MFLLLDFKGMVVRDLMLLKGICRQNKETLDHVVEILSMLKGWYFKYLL